MNNIVTTTGTWRIAWSIFLFGVLLLPIDAGAQEKSTDGIRPKRLLLLGQKKDSHARSTHEYMAGVRTIARLLEATRPVQVVLSQADGDWAEGPELIDGADGVFLFLSEGARWVSATPDRKLAFQRFADRGGALGCLHWGMGAKDAAPVPFFLELFGGCHGGTDRKYQYGDYQVTPIGSGHPITSGILPFEIHDEFYYNLKFPVERSGHTELIRAQIDGVDYPVAWAWQRPAGGRSFGFSGFHYHANWKRIEYRRLVVQGITWSMGFEIPKEGMSLEIADELLELPTN